MMDDDLDFGLRIETGPPPAVGAAATHSPSSAAPRGGLDASNAEHHQQQEPSFVSPPAEQRGEVADMDFGLRINTSSSSSSVPPVVTTHRSHVDPAPAVQQFPPPRSTSSSFLATYTATNDRSPLPKSAGSGSGGGVVSSPSLRSAAAVQGATTPSGSGSTPDGGAAGDFDFGLVIDTSKGASPRTTGSTPGSEPRLRKELRGLPGIASSPNSAGRHSGGSGGSAAVGSSSLLAVMSPTPSSGGGGVGGSRDVISAHNQYQQQLAAGRMPGAGAPPLVTTTVPIVTTTTTSGSGGGTGGTTGGNNTTITTSSGSHHGVLMAESSNNNNIPPYAVGPGGGPGSTTNPSIEWSLPITGATTGSLRDNILQQQQQPQQPGGRVGGADDIDQVVAAANQGRGAGQQSLFARIEKTGKVLGRGSAGVVDHAIDPTNGQHYALKTLRYDGASMEEQKAVGRELQSISRNTRCPLLLRYYGARSSRSLGTVTLVMEFMDLGSLHDVMKLTAPIPPVVLRVVAAKMIIALKHLHTAMNVIHRDIKPKNILLSSSGAIKLADFGLAREGSGGTGGGGGDAATGSQASTAGGEAGTTGNSGGSGGGGASGGIGGGGGNTQTFVGTLIYMAPESFKSEGCSSFQTDVWALGISLCELALGVHPMLYAAQKKLWEAQLQKKASAAMKGTLHGDPSLGGGLATPGSSRRSPAMGGESGAGVVRDMGFWEAYEFARKEKLGLPHHNMAFSPTMRSFMDSMLIRDPAQRHSATKLLQHPWIKEASEDLKLIGDDKGGVVDVMVTGATEKAYKSWLKIVQSQLKAIDEMENRRKEAKVASK